MPRPMPLVEPVTSATLPSSERDASIVRDGVAMFMAASQGLSISACKTAEYGRAAEMPIGFRVDTRGLSKRFRPRRAAAAFFRSGGRVVHAGARHAGDQPGAALERDVVPEPVGRDHEPVAEADQEVDVRDAPQQPGDEARQLEAAPSGRRRACARWWRASRSRGSGTAGPACPSCARDQQLARRIGPAAWRPARRRAADCRPRRRRARCRRSRRCPDVRAPTGRARPSRGRRGRSRRRASGRRGDAMTPAAQMTVRASMRSAPIDTPSASSAVTGAPSRTSTPSCSSERFAASDSERIERREQARRRLDQDDARAARIDRAEVLGERAVARARRWRRPSRRRSGRRRRPRS